MTGRGLASGVPTAEPSPGQPPTGVLLVNAWVEAGATPPLRARITWTVGLDDEQHTEVVATPDEALAVVARWLDALLGPARGGR